MCRTLSDPPNKFAPKERLELVVEATQLEHRALLTRTFRPLAIVASHLLMLLAKLAAEPLRLHAYAPTCRTLSDPPNEFAPKPLFAKDVALQLEQVVLWTLTARLLAFDASHVLLLLAFELKLHAYAPMCMTLSDPPNEFAP